MSMTVGIKGAHDCVKVFSETDLTEDLKKIDVPTLILHGDDDQIVPIQASALKSSKIVPNGSSRSTRRASRLDRRPRGGVQQRPARLSHDLTLLRSIRSAYRPTS